MFSFSIFFQMFHNEHQLYLLPLKKAQRALIEKRTGISPHGPEGGLAWEAGPL